MDFGLSWLNDFVRWLAQWVPRWGVCEPTHGGVKFRGSFVGSIFGRSRMRVARIEPGVYWYWPVSTRAVTVPVVRQSIDLPSQSLDTYDGKPVMVSTVLVVEIRDVVTALTKNFDVDGTIAEIGAAAAVDCVVGRTWAELRKAFREGDVDAELKEQARKILRKYGVSVIEAFFTDCCKHVAIRSEGGAHAVPIPQKEE